MKLYEIAEDIKKDWGDKVSPHAKPYLDAMRTMESIDDRYGLEYGDMIVAYFLANAQGWRGPVARDKKALLKKLLKEHNERKGLR